MSSTQLNPFVGMKNTLGLLNQVSKMTDNVSKSVIFQHLTDAWRECNVWLDGRRLFFSIVISFGDVSNRKHNIFVKNGVEPDNGGHSLRKVFLYCLEWMHMYAREQFYALFPLLGEYYNLGANTLFYILWTDRQKGVVKEVYHVPVDVEHMTDYIASTLKDPELPVTQKRLWARWLWHVPTATRRRNTQSGVVYGDKQAATRSKDMFVLHCIKRLSAKMDWEYKKYPNNIKFVGYDTFRKEHLKGTEAQMFSSQEIKQLRRTELYAWFDSLPAAARYSAQRKLLNKDNEGNFVPGTKWINNEGENIGAIYMDWLARKVEAQERLRGLTLDQANRELIESARINTGSITIIDLIADFYTQNQPREMINAIANILLDKISVDCPVLVFADISGSMASFGVTHKGVSFSCQQLCALLTTIFLIKNPDASLGDRFVRFDQQAEVVENGGKLLTVHSFFEPTNVIEVGTLIDRRADFLSNYENVLRFIEARQDTDFASVFPALINWGYINGSFDKPDYVKHNQLQKHPVFLVISDGDMNSPSQGNGREVVEDFLLGMKTYFNWMGKLVILDIEQASTRSSNFDGIGNVIHFSGFNVGILSQILNNISKIGEDDLIDVYTSLQSIFLTNRYAPVRELVQ